MPLEHGTFALRVFKLSERLPEDYLELFSAHKSGLLDHVKDEPQVGWVSGRCLIENRIDEETSVLGGHVLLNMRTAERKIPASLLNSICRFEEIAYMQANNLERIPQKVRREIKEEAIEKHLMKMPPVFSGLQFAVDMNTNLLYLASASNAQMDNFIALFMKTTGIEPLPMNINELMFELFGQAENDLAPLNFNEIRELDLVPGRDFLTWLWYYSERKSGRFNHDKFGGFKLMIEAPLTLAFSEEAKGSAETVVKKGGSPLQSAEVKAALNVGKKLKKAKVSFVRGGDIWSATFDADNFTFSSLSLPDGEELERHSQFAERINNLFIFTEAIKGYFKLFVEATKGDLKQLEEDIKTWINERDSY
ncbi:recombination-associated protein RdgC [Lentisphaerota bacterium WC36G]|nr:recombination-associated protein RdgC [Lentisphaerae bacterium WC36]